MPWVDIFFYCYFIAGLCLLGSLAIDVVKPEFRTNKKHNRYLACYLKQYYDRDSKPIVDGCFGSRFAVSKNCVECPYFWRNKKGE